MTNFLADFYYVKNGVRSRRTQQGSSQIHLNGAQSDFAVQSYLQKVYPGCQVSINKITWR